MATRDEIEKLKKSWMSDPSWDIEDTEGFEEHHDELLLFRQERDAEYEKLKEARIARRARVIAVDTGVTAPGAAQEINTYAEIERAVAVPDRYIREFEKTEEQVRIELMQAQVRATLLLAAQIQRVADVLEQSSADSNLDFMTKLYKVD